FAALYAPTPEIVEVLDRERLALLAETVPVVTATPRAARARVVWDVLEVASLLAPECPTSSIERAAGFFGLTRDGGSLEDEARLTLALFHLLLGVLEQTDTQTLLHASRLAQPLDWPLRGLLAEVERARVRSALETGALAAATPIGGWITQGAPGPRRRAATSAPAPAPTPLDADEIADR